ncbi:hypothetical protein ADUPG1_011426, partial [Aduncisulcus paluster]
MIADVFDFFDFCFPVTSMNPFLRKLRSSVDRDEIHREILSYKCETTKKLRILKLATKYISSLEIAKLYVEAFKEISVYILDHGSKRSLSISITFMTQAFSNSSYLCQALKEDESWMKKEYIILACSTPVSIAKRFVTDLLFLTFTPLPPNVISLLPRLYRRFSFDDIIDIPSLTNSMQKVNEHFITAVYPALVYCRGPFPEGSYVFVHYANRYMMQKYVTPVDANCVGILTATSIIDDVFDGKADIFRWAVEGFAIMLRRLRPKDRSHFMGLILEMLGVDTWIEDCSSEEKKEDEVEMVIPPAHRRKTTLPHTKSYLCHVLCGLLWLSDEIESVEPLSLVKTVSQLANAIISPKMRKTLDLMTVAVDKHVSQYSEHSSQKEQQQKDTDDDGICDIAGFDSFSALSSTLKDIISTNLPSTTSKSLFLPSEKNFSALLSLCVCMGEKEQQQKDTDDDGICEIAGFDSFSALSSTLKDIISTNLPSTTSKSLFLPSEKNFSALLSLCVCMGEVCACSARMYKLKCKKSSSGLKRSSGATTLSHDDVEEEEVRKQDLACGVGSKDDVSCGQPCISVHVLPVFMLLLDSRLLDCGILSEEKGNMQRGEESVAFTTSKPGALVVSQTLKSVLSYILALEDGEAVAICALLHDKMCDIHKAICEEDITIVRPIVILLGAFFFVHEYMVQKYEQMEMPDEISRKLFETISKQHHKIHRGRFLSMFTPATCEQADRLTVDATCILVEVLSFLRVAGEGLLEDIGGLDVLHQTTMPHSTISGGAGASSTRGAVGAVGAVSNLGRGEEEEEGEEEEGEKKRETTTLTSSSSATSILAQDESLSYLCAAKENSFSSVALFVTSAAPSIRRRARFAIMNCTSEFSAISHDILFSLLIPSSCRRGTISANECDSQALYCFRVLDIP